MTTQYGFFIDSSRCTGCKTCELACKDFKDLGPEVSFRRIYEYAGGDWQEDNGVWHQNVFAYYLSISCNHCDDPACTKVCPSGAMHKREDGFVVVDEDVCIGWRVHAAGRIRHIWVVSPRRRANNNHRTSSCALFQHCTVVRRTDKPCGST